MENLKTKVKRGIQFSILEKIAIFIFGIIQLIIVVNFIDEGDIGLMALVNTFLAFANYFSEAGMGNSIIHQQHSNHQQLSSIFWLQVVIGFIVYLFLILFASPIALFYTAPILQEVFPVMGITIIINSFGQNYAALLYRALAFRLLSILRVIVNFIGFCVVCILAIKGYGIWALVAGALVKSIAQVTLFIFYGRDYFIPDFRLKINEIRSNINFGAYQTLELFINTINKELDVLIIGKLLGEEILGVYDVIKQLLSKIFKTVNTVFTQVSLPVFAKFQKNKDKVSRLYLLQLRYLSSVNFPIYIFIAFHSSYLFSDLLQPAWNTPINQQLVIYFCVYYLSYSLQNPMGTLLISHGRVRQSFWYNFLFTLLLPPLLFWSAQNGILMVIKSLSILMAFRIFTSYHLLIKHLVNFRMSHFFSNVAPSFFISMLSVFGGFYLSILLSNPGLIRLFIAAFLSSSFYLIGSYHMNHTFWEGLITLVEGRLKSNKP